MPTYAKKNTNLHFHNQKKKTDITKQRLEYKKENYICDI